MSTRRVKTKAFQTAHGLVLVRDSDLSVELPFTLTHPKPPEEMMASAVPRAVPPNNAAAAVKKDDSTPVDPNLIHIDTR